MKKEYLVLDELRPEIRNRIEWAERIIQGEYGDGDFVPAGGPLDESVFWGPIYDKNDPSLSLAEKEFLEAWIYRKLGSAPDHAPIRSVFRSPDRLTRTAVYDVEIAPGWYLSCWQTAMEKPVYYFSPLEFYDAQVTESGYEEIEFRRNAAATEREE